LRHRTLLSQRGLAPPAIFAVETATSHSRGNHLAAAWQVGEGASPRRDAFQIYAQVQRLQANGPWQTGSDCSESVLQASASRHFRCPGSSGPFALGIAERLVLGDGGRRLVFLPGRLNVPDVLIIGLTARPRRPLPRPAPSLVCFYSDSVGARTAKEPRAAGCRRRHRCVGGRAAGHRAGPHRQRIAQARANGTYHRLNDPRAPTTSKNGRQGEAFPSSTSMSISSIKRRACACDYAPAIRNVGLFETLTDKWEQLRSMPRQKSLRRKQPT
jgi:hypothetical protein